MIRKKKLSTRPIRTTQEVIEEYIAWAIIHRVSTIHIYDNQPHAFQFNRFKTIVVPTKEG